MFLRSIQISLSAPSHLPMRAEVRLDILCTIEEAERFRQWMQRGVSFTADEQSTPELVAGKKQLPAAPLRLPQDAGVVDGEFEEP